MIKINVNAFFQSDLGIFVTYVWKIECRFIVTPLYIALERALQVNDDPVFFLRILVRRDKEKRFCSLRFVVFLVAFRLFLIAFRLFLSTFRLFLLRFFFFAITYIQHARLGCADA